MERLPRKRGRTTRERARTRAFARVRPRARRRARRHAFPVRVPRRRDQEKRRRRGLGRVGGSAALGFSIHPDRAHRRTLGSRFATSAVPCAGDRAERAVRAMTYLSRGARDRAHGLGVGARERGAPGHLDAAAEEAGGATGGRASRLARDGRGGDGGDNRLARHRAGSRNGARCSGRKVLLPFGRNEVKRSTRGANRQCERRCGRDARSPTRVGGGKFARVLACAFAFHRPQRDDGKNAQQVSRGVDRWLIGRVFIGVPDGAAKRSVDRQDLRTGLDFFPGESLV